MNKTLTLLAAGLFSGILSFSLPAQTPCFQINCPPAVQEICDLTPNDPQLWRATWLWDPTAQTFDLADAEADLRLEITETCPQPYAVDFELLLDLDGDGLEETQIHSAALATLPAGFVPYNNYPDPAFQQLIRFDQRSLPAAQLYRFALEKTLNGNQATYRLAWNTGQAPNQYLPLQLPYGKLRLSWTVSDGQNLESCTTELNIRDCKKPTVVCINGLSVNLMPAQTIQLWYSDFLQFASDNYTPAHRLEFAMRKSGTDTGFPVDSFGKAIRFVNFGCDELGNQLVEIWARDNAGNADFCETYVIVQDNLGVCSSGTWDSVTVCIDYCGAPFPLDFKFTVDGSHPSLPPISMFFDPIPSSQVGCKSYTTTNIPFLGNYTVTPNHDKEPLNGLSTYDLIRIERHIHGLEPLDNPYKIIAADANNSRSITNVDLRDLRRLLLGIDSELSNNTSWRFVPSDFDFPNPANPFQTVFPEMVPITPPANTVHFQGIKVGDVSCNATAEGKLPQLESLPQGKAFYLETEKRRLAPGETAKLPVWAGAAGTLLGYQFELEIDAPLTLTDITPGPGLTMDNFAVIDGDLICSWSSAQGRAVQAGEVFFYIHLTATGHARTQWALRFKQSRLFAEAYFPSDGYRPLNLQFVETGISSNLDPEGPIEVLANPGAERVSLRLPADARGDLHWQLFDLSGRLVSGVSLEAQGSDLLEMSLELVPAGVYVYRVWLGGKIWSGKLLR